VLEVRAIGKRREGKKKMSVIEEEKKVLVKVLEKNDIKNMFYKKE
jgi:hypothetical protein